MRYVKGSIKCGLKYQRTGEVQDELVGYCDSDYCVVILIGEDF